ncbi:MAG: glycerol-3-phosphate 1-O-acyltransferase PlsY [Bacilli bacterium]
MLFFQIILLIIAYLLGSIPWGYVFGKFKGIDIRQHGSKNIGATNTGRLLGRKYAIITYVLDALKGGLIVSLFIYGVIPMEYCLLSPMLYGLAAVLGHTFPIYLGFKGGKAVATSGGVILAYSPLIFITGLPLFFIVTAIFKYVSLGSIITATYVLISSFVLTFINNGFVDVNQTINLYFPIGTLIMFLIIIIRHKTNIVRIYKHEESKVKWSNKK